MNQTDNQIFTFKIEIEPQEVLELCGYKDTAPLPKEIKTCVVQAIQKSYELIQPRGMFVFSHIKGVESPGKICITDNLKFKFPKIDTIIRKANGIALFVVTIGDHLEKQTRKLFEQKENLRAYMLDAVGSVATEKTALKLEKLICQKAMSQNLYSSLRFSPGYCDWDLKEQKILFQLIPAEKIGVRLNEHFWMIPRKSISGIIAQGKDKSISESPCIECDKKDCPDRR